MSDFSFDTISNFDNHISGSINGYILMDDLILSLCSFWAKDGGRIVDIGCTSGRLIHKIKYQHPAVECIGYDLTAHNFIGGGAMLLQQDVTDSLFKIPESNVITSVFTLQFLPYAKRIEVVEKIYKSLTPSGAFFVAEKEISQSGTIQEAFTFANYDYKRGTFTAQDILEKEKSLRQIMDALPDGSNKSILEGAGFKCHQFFQSLNFKAWVCIK